MNGDRELIARILAGDDDAWREFIGGHAPRIRAIIGRYVGDPEVAADLFASLLVKLKKAKLGSFRGASRFSTWLFIVTRNHCRDYYRGASGVRHLMRALDDLEPLDRRYFKLSYIDGLAINEVFESLRLETDGKTSYLDLIECDERIRRNIAEKGLGNVLGKLLHKGPLTLRLAELETERREIAEAAHRNAQKDDRVLEAGLLEIALDKLREAVSRLPHRDQLILKLRFEHRASARQIGEILDFANEKQVYRKIEKLLDLLRETLLDSDLPPEVLGSLMENADLANRNTLWKNNLHNCNNNNLQ